MGQAAPADQVVLRNLGQCCEKSNLGWTVHLPPCGHRLKTAPNSVLALHFSTNSGGQLIREKVDHIVNFRSSQANYRRALSVEPIDFIWKLTGQ